MPKLTVRSLNTTTVSVPMKRALGTSAQTIRSASLLLIDLESEEGITGHTYLWCYFPMAAELIARVLSELLGVIKGDSIEPVEIATRPSRCQSSWRVNQSPSAVRSRSKS